jgi:hypothetical protein
VSRTIRFDDGALFVRLNAMALVGMSAKAKQLTDEERGTIVAAIVRDSADLVKAHTGDTGFTFEISTNVATGRAP